MADWSDWVEVKQDPEDAHLGLIPEELLPAKAFQWKWTVNHVRNVGSGTTTLNMGWDFRVGGHRFTDTAPFTIWAQSDPLGGGMTWTYYTENARTLRTEGDATQGGDDKGELELLTDVGGTQGAGSEVSLWGELESDQWDGEIQTGAGVEFLEWYPQNGIAHGKTLWLRTQAGQEDMQTILDPVTHNKHEFYLSGKVLLTRKRSRRGGFDGVIAGCEVSVAAGVVTVASGTLVIQGEGRAWEGGSAAAPGTAYDVMLGVQEGELALQLAGAADGINQPAVRLAGISGSKIAQAEGDRGVIVTRDCDGTFSAWIEDDGQIMVDVGSVAKRKVWRSRDRGAVWVRKLT